MGRRRRATKEGGALPNSLKGGPIKTRFGRGEKANRPTPSREPNGIKSARGAHHFDKDERPAAETARDSRRPRRARAACETGAYAGEAGAEQRERENLSE